MSKRRPLFDGKTYDEDRDRARLSRQINRVFEVMLDRKWHTLAELEETTGAPQASISARLRDLRKRKFGSWRVRRRYVAHGLWEYRLRDPKLDAPAASDLPIRVRGQRTAY
jgi:hypothetical protein